MADSDALAAAVSAGTAGTGDGAAHTQGGATGGAAGEVDWRQEVPEDIRPTIAKYAKPSDLAKGYSELVKKLGSTVQIPGSSSTEEERAAFYKRLGLPESPEGYELSDIVLPDGLQRTQEGDAEFKKFVHSLKLTKEQTKGLHEWWMKRASEAVVAQRDAAKRRADEQDAAIKSAWGSGYEANRAAVSKVIQLGGDKFVEKMNSGPGKDPDILLGLLAISKQFADETLVAGRVERPKGKGTVPAGFVFDPTLSPELTQRTG